MSRYNANHKPTTRRRMVEAAGRRLKSDGIDGSGIATLVADAGLTNGAFYGHFRSKNDLVAAVVSQQLADQVAAIESLPPGRGSAEAFISFYLSPAHRDDTAGGCPSAALLDEIGRMDVAVRDAYTDGIRAMLRSIGRHLDDGDPSEAEERAIGLFSLLVGATQAARAVTDPELSDHILAAAFASALAFVGGDPAPISPARLASPARPLNPDTQPRSTP